MVYRKKGQFVLDKNHLQSIVDDVLKRPCNKDVKISVVKSPNKYSNSLYLDIKIDKYTTGLRLSDHKCKGAVRGLIVTATTGNAHVYSMIENAIRDLRYKQIQGLLGGGKYERFCKKKDNCGKIFF